MISLAVVFVGSLMLSCGQTSNLASRRIGALQTAQSKHDRDDDGDNNDDDGATLYYGHPASSEDVKLVTAVLVRYYRDAARADGADACRELLPARAEHLAEDYGHEPALKGTTCATVLTKIFTKAHREMSAKSSMKVVLVRMEGDKALVMLGFAYPLPVRQIVLRQVGRDWKLRNIADELVE